MVNTADNIPVDDITLIAYVDGELDPQSCAEIESLLAADRALREKVRRLRESTSLVHAAFNHALYSAAPDGTVNNLAPGIVAVNREKQNTRRRPGRFFAIAASLAALLSGAFGGYFLAPGERHTAASISADEEKRLHAFRQSIDKEISGTSVTWRNPDSGNHGSITPVRTFQNKSGQFCREFTEQQVIDGQQQLEGGVACRQDDGQWRVRMRIYPDANAL